MGLTASDKGGKSFDPIPEDLHLAICYGIWDLGTQFSDTFHNTSHKVIISWELRNCRADFEQKDGTKKNLPRAISKPYTLSLHQKAQLRKDLENWRGKKFTEEELKGFDLKKLLGVPCQIQVIHNVTGYDTYANVAAIITAPQGTKVNLENEKQFFSFEEGGQIPSNTPQWIEEMIKKSEEFQEGTNHNEGGPPPEGEKDDSTPF